MCKFPHVSPPIPAPPPSSHPRRGKGSGWGRGKRSLVSGLALAILAALNQNAALASHGNALSADPTSGVAGSAVALSGTGWSTANSPYLIFWDSPGGIQLGTFAPTKGFWTAVVNVPKDAPPGGHNFVACEGFGGEFQDCVATPFTVIAPPTDTPLPSETPTAPPPTDTPTSTPTAPPTGTPTSAPTATASSTLTFTPKPTSTPTPAVTPPLWLFGTPRPTLLPPPTPEGWCADLGLGPEAVVLNFEEPLTTQEERYSVSFERTGQVLVPAVATRSGSRALRSLTSVEFGSINNPIQISFSRPVRAVGMFVGLEEALYARGEITARLSAYGYRAGGSRVELLGASEVRFPAGRTPVRYCVRFQAGAGEVITWAALDYRQSDGVSAFEPRLIDDLTLVFAETIPPVSDRAPRISVDPPVDSRSYVVFRVDVEEDRGLRRMWYQVDSAPQVELTFRRQPDAPNRYEAVVGISFPGHEVHSIEFGAEDIAGQAGTARAAVLVPTPRPPVDIEAVAAEAVQVVQCLGLDPCRDNSVPLVAGKPTLVRLYVRLAGGALMPTDAVGGLVCRSLSECMPSLNTVLPGTSRDPVAGDRGDLNATLNFLLPAGWVRRESTGGWLELTVRVNPYRVVPEEFIGNNEVRISLPVVSPRTMKVYFVPVSVGGVAPSLTQRVNMADWLGRVYPVAWIVPVRGRASTPLAVSSLANREGGNCGRDWNRLMSQLDTRRNLDRSAGLLSDGVHILGMVPPGVETGNILGCGNTPGWVAASIVTPGQRFGGQVAAQELGHNKGLHHAPGCGADGLDEHYPVGEGRLDVWGIDVGRMQLYPPIATFDYMGYCGEETTTWTSRYTYLNMMRLLPSFAAEAGAALARLAAPARQVLQDFVVVGGVVYPDRVDLVAGPYNMTLLYADDTPAGPYTVELLDDSGNVLYSRDFRAVPLSSSDNEDVGTFYLTLPVLPEARHIAFRYQSSEIARLSASPNPPSVEIVAPLSGEDWGASGPQTIRWQATDPDDDPLRFTLQASPDGGEHWATLALDLQGANKYTLDSADLAGGSYLLRVLASDGFYTAEDRTESPVHVASKPPEVYITAPQDGGAYVVGEMAIFRGFASDLEDETVNDNAYLWTSNVDGELGRGPSLWGISLTPGEHIITLSVTDRDGKSAAASVRIVVEGRLAAVEPEPTETLVTPEATAPAPAPERSENRLRLIGVALGLALCGVMGVLVMTLGVSWAVRRRR